MRSISLVAALAVACLTTPVAAEPASSGMQVAISYADLDLASPAGAKTFDRRIRAAIDLACGPTSNVDPAGKTRVRDCRRTLSAAVAEQREHALAAAAQPRGTRMAARR